MIEDFLNTKYSLRNLSDDDFSARLPILSAELESVSYQYQYTDTQLRKDWNRLISFESVHDSTSSCVRVGMKLSEHFFPNIFDVRNRNGKSFSDFWTADKLEKVLVWNRKSHSTPYLSELRRGVYFCHALTKSTMYRPHLAKMICSSYQGDVVLDPSFGWGGRMLGAVASGMHYVGFDPNPVTYTNIMNLVGFLGIEDKVTLFNVGAEKMDQYDFPNCDIILTSPPYFNLEIYHESELQSENQYSVYESWRDEWLKTVIELALKRGTKTVKSCWNVHNIENMKMIDDVRNIHLDCGFESTREFSTHSSARQVRAKNKNHDLTIVYESVDRDREEIIAWW